MRTSRSVLGSVHSGKALLWLKVHAHVWSFDDCGNSSRGVYRAGLADLLFADEMLAILSRFPELRQLHFTLPDNDGEYDAGWWTAEMVRRLPDSCHAALSVKVRFWTSGASCGCPICGDECSCTSCYSKNTIDTCGIRGRRSRQPGKQGKQPGKQPRKKPGSEHCMKTSRSWRMWSACSMETARTMDRRRSRV